MLNKLQSFISRHQLLRSGDRVVCAVSGGADSVALLFALYLLQEKLGITVTAAHFNHQLRGVESDRDEAFVRNLCDRLSIPLKTGTAQVKAGKKGLEAAAREARYAFLNTLDGKIATAHTANDNAETVLMHLVRGAGLKGLGGIALRNGRVIRPMLDITRKDVLAFLQEYHLSFVEDSSNRMDDFLRNRIRHNVLPLLEQENPRLSEGISATAQRLRQDEEYFQLQADMPLPDIPALRRMHPAVRSRVISHFLEENGVRESEAEHISLVERLIFSEKPSAKASLPGGLVVTRQYDALRCIRQIESLPLTELNCPGKVELPQCGVRITCQKATEINDSRNCFTVIPEGKMVIRPRQAGDRMRLYGGTKELKKLFVDHKIPAHHRMLIPVIADDCGILGVKGFGVNRDRLAYDDNSVCIRIEPI